MFIRYGMRLGVFWAIGYYAHYLPTTDSSLHSLSTGLPTTICAVSSKHSLPNEDE